MEIITWQTYKKRNNPKIIALHDSVFNKPLTVVPTLRNEGFKVHTTEADDCYFEPKISPKEFVKKYIALHKIEASEVVYYYWFGRSGVASIFMDIAFK